ncbi:hypothetical protein [Bacillus paranthracis]|uniref:hypothetical protein n=1 Tax=Bacillus cereus group TaxID=86661 RepID=UPI0005E8E743|nr:hypothetical protein [Bacillus paranthracis]CKE81126.1 Uncharacterised protein [Streptococcus pneumoniae]CKE88366.1 Uncharacterised protein [Streptococcus pneumoniae]CKE88923.1 Uncharacterised protein [Streptococcus pneumoniae]CKF20245.1 Uncharacterised protein [Bacillus paranthracis]
MKIQIVGQLDAFTIKTLYKNYDIIARNLKVYPTVKIYPRGYALDGGIGGFYHADRNHVYIVDHYYLISILSHEMRYAYQYIYFQDLYFNTTYSSAREYLNCEVERDAREYSIEFCLARGYREEAENCKVSEEQYELVIQNKLSPSEMGLSDGYFKRNPVKATVVSRDYHLSQKTIMKTKGGVSLTVIEGGAGEKSGGAIYICGRYFLSLLH